MPIHGIPQPEVIPIGNDLRLRKYDGNHSFALGWYQDPETTWLVDGDYTPYTEERLGRMYTYLNDQGELYFIELLQNGSFIPIGDVTFWADDMPIVIGPREYRSRGIGKRVVQALIQRGIQLGFPKLGVSTIYHWNIASQILFTTMGFRPCETTEQSRRYELDLTTIEVQ